MDAVVLMVTLYCGVPVSMMLSYPKDGDRVTVAGAVPLEQRLFIADLMKQVEASTVGKVERIRVEELVAGIKCPVSS